jgi:glycosyltransferase involved in cell wall biosynthesis
VNRKKGLDLLLRALPDLPTAHLGIVGPDDRDGTVATVTRLRRELGLERRVHLLGPVDPARLPDVYAGADIFVLPSRNENFGNVAAEAAAAGTAIVLTDQCGSAEFLRERAALVVRPDPEELREAIERLLRDEALRLRLAAEGPHVAGELSWSNVCRLQEELYVRALGTA